MTSRSISLGLQSDTLRKLEALARETGAPKSRLALQLIEEGLRMRAHPGIVFRDGPTGRRAALACGPDVWQIIPVVKNEGSGEEQIERAAEYFGLSPREIHAAIQYYADYRDEIDEWIRRNDELAERAEAKWRREQEMLAG